MSPKKDTLHIYQMASKFTMSDNEFWNQDFKFAADKDPDVITCTEVAGRELNRALNFGYRPVINGYDETVVFLAKRHSLKKTGKANAGTFTVGNDTRTRYVTWAMFMFLGHKTYIHAAHWVSRTTNAGHIDPSNARDFKVHAHTTQVMVNQVKLHGKGSNISFFAGDLNVSEQQDNQENNPRLPNHVFNAAGLITIYDELGVDPKEGGTMGKAIYDIIGSYRPDGRVKGLRYNIWAKQNSDHRPVSAFYEVTSSQQTTQGQNQPSGQPQNPNYVTGGDISYADYQDNEVYPLPRATDNSDDLNHG